MDIEPRFYCLVRVKGRRARFMEKTADGKAKIVYGSNLENWHKTAFTKSPDVTSKPFESEYVTVVDWSWLVLPQKHPVGRFSAPVVYHDTGQRVQHECAAVFVGSFVVHRPAVNGFDLDGNLYRFDEWDISHKATGYRIADGISDVALAIDIAEQLEHFMADIFASLTGDSAADGNILKPHNKLIRELLFEGGDV